jgi:predicted nuclease with TOPRIM domain
MAEELGTRDVLEQVDARLDNVEQDLRGLRTEMNSRFDRVRDELKTEIRDLRAEMNSRFAEMNSRFIWLYGLLVALVLGVAGLWFK